MKIGIIGDAHFKDFLSYADYISDKREGERKEILDFILESFQDCQHIVFLGDVFHSKNNSSETNRAAVEFLEKFEDKEIYLISGNHDKKGDGKTAIDFLGEIKKKNWHIFTRPGTISLIVKHRAVGKSIDPHPIFKMDFLPSMLNSELGVENSEQATKEIMKHLDGGDILFTHHNITGTSFNGISTDVLKGVVLPKEKLEKKYKKIFAGDIHVPQQYGNVIITGSVFTSEVNEIEKFIWKIDDKLNIEKIKTPCREIHKLVNPKGAELSWIPENSIVKIVITDKKAYPEGIEGLKELAEERFEAILFIEDYPSERKKTHIEEGAAFDFSIEALLALYAKEKGVELEKLLKGLELINK